MYLFGFTALLFALAAVVRELDTLLGRVDIDQDEFLMDFVTQHLTTTTAPLSRTVSQVQIPLCAIAVVLSCISLYRHRAWLWLIGLMWGLLGPILISTLGQNPYLPLDTQLTPDPVQHLIGVRLSGPILWCGCTAPQYCG